MRLILCAVLSYTISTASYGAPSASEERYRAAVNSINYGKAMVGVAGLVTLEGLVKIDSPEYKGSAVIVLGQIDRRLAELAETTLSNGSAAEATQLQERKMAIIETLILRGGSLSHHLSRYIRNTIGTEQADPYFASRIIEILMQSDRTADDRLLIGSIVKVMNIAQRAIGSTGDHRALTLNSERTSLYLAVTELIITKNVKDLDLLKRMSRILKALKIPRHQMTTYIARLHGRSCGQTLTLETTVRTSQNGSAAGG